MTERNDGHNGQGRCDCDKCREAMRAQRPQPQEYGYQAWAQIMEDEVG